MNPNINLEYQDLFEAYGISSVITEEENIVDFTTANVNTDIQHIKRELCICDHHKSGNKEKCDRKAFFYVLDIGVLLFYCDKHGSDIPNAKYL